MYLHDTMAFFMAYQARRVFGFGLSSLRLVLLDCFIFRLSNNGLQRVDLVLGPSLWIFCRRVFELCSFHPSPTSFSLPTAFLDHFATKSMLGWLPSPFPSAGRSLLNPPCTLLARHKHQLQAESFSCTHRIVSQLVCHWNTKHWFRAWQMLRHFQCCFFWPPV